MANRRLISKTITDTDAFLEMPLSSQALYFHLCQRADDDGFVGNPKTIIKLIGANTDDLNILFIKKYVLGFESGVVVIKHWLIHNLIRKDRYNETTYIEEKSKLFLDDKRAYTFRQTGNVIPVGTQMTPQDKLSKDKLSKDNIYSKLPTYDTSKNPPLNKNRLDELLEKRKNDIS